MLWFLVPAIPETDNVAVTYVAVLAAENCTPACPPADSTKLVVLAVTSDGKPLMEIFTCPVNPFMGWIEMLTDAEAPGPRRIFGGLTPSVKSKFGGGGGGFPPPEFPPLVPPPHPEKKQSASKVVVRSSRDIVLLLPPTDDERECPENWRHFAQFSVISSIESIDRSAIALLLIGSPPSDQSSSGLPEHRAQDDSIRVARLLPKTKSHLELRPRSFLRLPQ